MDTSEMRINGDLLRTEYQANQKSMKQIRREYGWGINTIRRWLESCGIPIRPIDDPINASQKGHSLEENPKWRGGKYRAGNGYTMVRTNGKYIAEHRLVAEQTIGRKLKGNEVVHHINGIKNDNRPENLWVYTDKKHRSIHVGLFHLVLHFYNIGLVEFVNGEYEVKNGH
ncbi:hypothetical protein LCGC14_1505310 [marine sediment metagenome]|uniref:HNH nuclease domain-containing protein n=1 Tax=marine sediment metagenome TaxID=412755 RepID=A0A0F9JNM9_9ZZZZ